MTEFLVLKTGQAPVEYLRYQARLMYHIPPSVLDEQRGRFLFEILQDLKCQEYEMKSSNLRRSLG